MSEVEISVNNTPAPTPVSSSLPVQETAPEAAPVGKPLSLRDTVDRALSKIENEQAEDQKAAPPPTKNAREVKTEKAPAAPQPKRAEPKQPAQPLETAQQSAPEKVSRKYEPPARFSESAKSEWDRSPESVQSEISRVVKETEAGISKYKSSHERYESLKEYDDLARSNGMDLKDSLKKITAIERTFTSDPVEGIRQVASHFGVNLEAAAAKILGQSPNQHVDQAYNKIRELQNEIATLRYQIDAPKHVETFRSEVGEELFDSLGDDIAELLESGVANDLKSAFTLANMVARKTPREMPAAQTSAPVIDQTDTTAERQPNPAGQKSVTGAPGANPSSRKNASSGRSIRDSVSYALDQLGM